MITIELESEIRKMLHELDEVIERKILENKSKSANYSLMSGDLGTALFYAYYYLYTGNDRHLEQCYDLVDRCIEAATNQSLVPTYCDGITGLGWVIQHLIDLKLLDAGNDILSEYDETIFEFGIECLKNGIYDYLHGGLGAGVYFLKRRNHSLLVPLLHALDRSSRNDSTGKYWLESRELTNREPGINFGLAHGLPSIIYFLSRLADHGIEKDKTSSMLTEIISTMHQHMDYSMKWGSFFQSRKLLDIDTKSMSRLGWCYGDLGALLSLFYASKTLKDATLESQVIEMAIMTTQRTSPTQTLLVDGGLCHGTSGVIHIYHQLYKLTREQAFNKAHLYWLDVLLRDIESNGGIQFFTEYDAYASKNVNSVSLLTGSIGVGLLLTSLINKQVEPAWDKALLIT